MSQIPNLVLSSWMHDRLPEMVWAALIIAAAPERKHALSEFRRILNFLARHERKGELHDITLSGISKLPDPLKESLIESIVDSPASQALRSLKLFDNLPAREVWLRFLPDNDPDVEILMDAVGSVLWHQSQEATDCRWLRIMALVLTDKMHLLEQQIEGFLKYPESGDQRDVRPQIRATEGSLDGLQKRDMTWVTAFWNECWDKTPCYEAVKNEAPPKVVSTLTRQRIGEVFESLDSHWRETLTTTAVDAKHDAVFGTAFYSLRLIDEILNIGNSTGIAGRMILRSLLECRITLRFLLTSPTPEIWKTWRTFGSGQAKLNTLKFDYADSTPAHIDLDVLENIAGEDVWEEYIPINLGNWAGLDLRKMSEAVGLKDLYDQHYSWPSGFVHGSWGAIREGCYKTCLNPLHRLHRFPQRSQPLDVVTDSVQLVEDILDELDRAFPSFSERLTEDK